jgi:hypothetical protein
MIVALVLTFSFEKCDGVKVLESCNGISTERYLSFYSVAQMITKNFEDYPEHRLKFFSLLRAIATHCFPALICLSSQVLFLAPLCP